MSTPKRSNETSSICSTTMTTILEVITLVHYGPQYIYIRVQNKELDIKAFEGRETGCVGLRLDG